MSLCFCGRLVLQKRRDAKAPFCQFSCAANAGRVRRGGETLTHTQMHAHIRSKDTLFLLPDIGLVRLGTSAHPPFLDYHLPIFPPLFLVPPLLFFPRHAHVHTTAGQSISTMRERILYVTNAVNRAACCFVVICAIHLPPPAALPGATLEFQAAWRMGSFKNMCLWPFLSKKKASNKTGTNPGV